MSANVNNKDTPPPPPKDKQLNCHADDRKHAEGGGGEEAHTGAADNGGDCKMTGQQGTRWKRQLLRRKASCFKVSPPTKQIVNLHKLESHELTVTCILLHLC